ncbi:pentapeptide repeat-containing protein [Roseibium alexandrii]|uniref:pentapeptide repeat-containing protein n=1 Tax=Roseibium alexandrii TaxID=388408 RepID=UPI0037512251
MGSMGNGRPTLLDWLNFRYPPDYTVARPLGAVIGGLIVLSAILVFIVGAVALAQLTATIIGIGPYSGDGTAAPIRNLGLLLVALFGAPFLVWRSFVAQRQVDVSEQGHITDRINQAIEALGAEKTEKVLVENPRYKKQDGDWARDNFGNPIPATRPDGEAIVDRTAYERSMPNLEVRLGAIYALERIAQDSLRDHIQIMEILCAYVRQNALMKNLEQTEPPFEKARARVDIQAAISVIGRRSEKQFKYEVDRQHRLDFRRSDLSGVDFRNGNFFAAVFHDCRLEAADFRNSDLRGAQFFRSLLNFSNFFEAELVGTRFDNCVYNRPADGWAPGPFVGSPLSICVAGADFTALTYAGIGAGPFTVFGSADTKLRYGWEADRKIQDELEKLVFHKKDISEEEYNEAMKAVREVKYGCWCPYESDDLMFGQYLLFFFEQNNLTDWPYQ